jgi:hypothetical protein
MKATIELSRDQFDRFQHAVFALESVRTLLLETEGGQALTYHHLVALCFDQIWAVYEDLDERFRIFDEQVDKIEKAPPSCPGASTLIQ